MRFSENVEEWVYLPKWVRSLLDVGYGISPDRNAPRSITIISMPCDSAAAGLVALGALRKSLENPLSNDIDAHWARIRNGLGKTLKKRPRKLGGNSESYRIQRVKSDDQVTLKRIGKRSTRSNDRDDREITQSKATEYGFENEPFVELVKGNGLEHSQIYDDLFPGAGPILEKNLKSTYSGICLAGRKLGENATRSILKDIRFCSDEFEGQPASLDQLLAVHNWNRNGISRLSFYNSRTKSLDRNTGSPLLVVADGDGAFMQIIDKFVESHIVSVIDRSVDRERLDALANRLGSLNQWYDRNSLTAGVYGVAISRWVAR